MRILITNDDGINAPGLEALADIAAEIAGPGGEVWTVAPAFEQSGVGHCISYAHPTLIAELSPRRWAAEGSPAANPAFDVTPARLVTGLITERGRCEAGEAALMALYPEKAPAGGSGG